MDYTEITVPDMNDSVSTIVLGGTPCGIRFTWNDTGEYWIFGLYDSQNVPIQQGIKIVPKAVLNLFSGKSEMRKYVFGVLTKLEKIGRDDFKNGKARFIFTPVER